MHLDDDRLQRLLHGEIGPFDEKSALEHLTRCDACRRRRDELEREEGEVGLLLCTLDHHAPPIDAGLIARRAAAWRPRMPRWAAGIALVVGLAGAAYALPGSPVRQWMEAVVGWTGGHRDSPSPDSGSDPPEPSVAGIAVAPGRDLLILVRSPHADGMISVTLTEGEEVQIRAPRGAATFTSEEGRLIVDDAGPAATYEIAIPRGARRVEIRVNGGRVFLKEGTRVSASGSPEPRSTYLLPMSPSGS